MGKDKCKGEEYAKSIQLTKYNLVNYRFILYLIVALSKYVLIINKKNQYVSICTHKVHYLN